MRKIGIALGSLCGLVLLVIAVAIPVNGSIGAAEAGPLLQEGGGENCINCHTSQETLEALAVEPEVEEDLSEGEG
jgi:hypothetical protein